MNYDLEFLEDAILAWNYVSSMFFKGVNIVVLKKEEELITNIMLNLKEAKKIQKDVLKLLKKRRKIEERRG